MKYKNQVSHTDYAKRPIAIYTIRGVMFEIYTTAEIRLLEALFL